LIVGEALGFEPENDRFTWTTKEKYATGDEITHGYLRGVNENFLLSWGFTPSINEDDKCRLNVKDVHFMIGHNGKVDDQVSVVKDLMDQDGKDCTEEKAWGSIARACERKEEVMNTDIGKVDISPSESRCAIAAEFAEKRANMLRKGQRIASNRAADTQRNISRSEKNMAVAIRK